ncbi:hypothetical protein GDO78_006068, partial [Eleutherodactylus coqui]
MVRMISLGYPLIISLSILSQGFLFSLSKSIRKAENDVLLDTIALRKALRNGDTIYKSSTNPQDQYPMDEGEVERSIKVNKQYSAGSENTYFSPHVLPLNVGGKEIPFSTLKSLSKTSEYGDENVELTHERRDIGEEENAAKFPIGRRDFD